MTKFVYSFASAVFAPVNGSGISKKLLYNISLISFVASKDKR